MNRSVDDSVLCPAGCGATFDELSECNWALGSIYTECENCGCEYEIVPDRGEYVARRIGEA